MYVPPKKIVPLRAPFHILVLDVLPQKRKPLFQALVQQCLTAVSTKQTSYQLQIKLLQNSSLTMDILFQ